MTKGVFGGVFSFVGHTSTAVLTSISGFSYSISRTMEQLTLPSEQLQKRHYVRPTQLSSALASGLGSLGSSVVGAATGVVTTPMAIYKERKLQGYDPGVRDVAGGVGMGLVGIFARPMGGMASLVSMASDGLLYGSGMGYDRLPTDSITSRFGAQPNEILRYKLKVLSDPVGDIAYAHGGWVDPSESILAGDINDLHFVTPEQRQEEAVSEVLLTDDESLPFVLVTVLVSKQFLYVIGECGETKQTVLAKTALLAIQAVEETLTEPTRFDLGVKAGTTVEWLRFRLPPNQRRRLSHQLRVWVAEAKR